jgi:hypothetical protein
VTVGEQGDRRTSFAALRCATAEDVAEWEAHATARLPDRWPLAFCLDAERSWCEAQRAVGRCTRSAADWQMLAKQQEKRSGDT